MPRVPALFLVLIAFAVVPSAASAAPAPFGHACVPKSGLRFCATTSDAARVPSFDGVPLDVDVTLPATGDGPFPTIVLLHGFGESKTAYQSTFPSGNGAATYHYNDVWFAQQGFAVVTPSARGFGRSCGKADSRGAAGCAKGWIHLADQRYEAHDTQYLLGLLADEGVAKPGAIGVTGISYGGGQSLELAYLRDRIRKTNGAFAKWESPNGTPLSITAAWPRWPWSDMTSALVPNGRYRVGRPAARVQSRSPVGVPIGAYINGLFLLATTSGFVAPLNADPTANLRQWKAQTDAGEPFGAAQRATEKQLTDFHSGFGLDGLKSSPRPAPLLLQSGWRDDLFPVAESLRVYESLRKRFKSASVALQFGDVGHSPGTNVGIVHRRFNAAGTAFLEHLLMADKGGPKPGSVSAERTVCPKGSKQPAPVHAATWDALTHKTYTLRRDAAGTVKGGSGDATEGKTFSNVVNGDACTSMKKVAAPGTIVIERVVKRPTTLLGLPEVGARIKASGAVGQLAVRVFDDTDGSEGILTLVTRGIYRVNKGQSGRIHFQLRGNFYTFKTGHKIRIELSGSDAPQFTKSEGAFSLKVDRVTVRLPVR